MNPQENSSLNMRVSSDDKDCPKKIPFAMLNETMAYEVHSQTLERLNQRGGMSPVEIVANIERTSPFKLEHDLYDKPFYIAKLKKYIELYEKGELK